MAEFYGDAGRRFTYVGFNPDGSYQHGSASDASPPDAADDGAPVDSTKILSVGIKGEHIGRPAEEHSRTAYDLLAKQAKQWGFMARRFAASLFSQNYGQYAFAYASFRKVKSGSTGLGIPGTFYLTWHMSDPPIVAKPTKVVYETLEELALQAKVLAPVAAPGVVAKLIADTDYVKDVNRLRFGRPNKGLVSSALCASAGNDYRLLPLWTADCYTRTSGFFSAPQEVGGVLLRPWRSVTWALVLRAEPER